ncbi:MAG TPA: MGMT family protein [Gemmatimonadales bacterium]|nr:MGMT family protein [Gemmatimonadales bacterium]
MVVFSCSMPRVRRQGKTLGALLQPLSRGGPAQRRPGSAGENAALEAIRHAVCTIPRGRVSTYGGVARAAGLPGRARQAGFALRTADEGLNLPWHRVVGAGGRIVFPRSSRAHREQARRLRAEGVSVVDGRVAASALIDLGEP